MALLEESRSTSITHAHAAVRDPRSRTRRAWRRSLPLHLRYHPRADDAVTQVAALPPSETFDTLAALTPLQYGDLTALGLTGWSPAGLSSWVLELVNVSTGLPWFHTIIAGTVLTRLLLLPFSIKQLRNSAALAPHQPRLLELKEELDRAYKTGDKIGVQRVALKQRRVYEESGVSMLPMLLLPFVQLPVTLGMFFGVKKLCTSRSSSSTGAACRS
jgi:YidC/Oxa1 family membrane protein insertase